jgi:hypothetical protein
MKTALSKIHRCQIIRKNIVIFIVLIMFIFGCKPEYSFEYNASTCLPAKPLSFTIHPKITLDYENKHIPVTVYLGSIDDNNIVIERTLSKEVTGLYLKTETYYTIVAKYIRNGRTHFVINSIEIEVVKNCEDCPDPCFYVYAREIDLRLKI